MMIYWTCFLAVTSTKKCHFYCTLMRIRYAIIYHKVSINQEMVPWHQRLQTLKYIKITTWWCALATGQTMHAKNCGNGLWALETIILPYDAWYPVFLCNVHRTVAHSQTLSKLLLTNTYNDYNRIFQCCVRMPHIGGPEMDIWSYL